MFPPPNAAPDDSFPATPWPLFGLIARPADCTPEDERFIARLEIGWQPICTFIAAHGYRQRETRRIAKNFLAWVIVERRSGPPSLARIPMRIYIRETLKQFLATEMARRNARRRNSMFE